MGMHPACEHLGHQVTAEQKLSEGARLTMAVQGMALHEVSMPPTPSPIWWVSATFSATAIVHALTTPAHLIISLAM